jgi:Zn-dependent peptidase ImmA (M78 family)
VSEVRNQFVTKMARKVLRDSKIKAPPVDLVAVLRAHGIEYEEIDDFPDSVDAMIVARENTFCAAVNTRHHVHRRRFSLAHELGHHFLHRDGYPEIEVSIDYPPSEEFVMGTKSPAEIEADLFAGELLVPVEFLKAAPDKQIPALSRLFQVSEQVIAVAMSRHMKALFK